MEKKKASKFSLWPRAEFSVVQKKTALAALDSAPCASPWPRPSFPLSPKPPSPYGAKRSTSLASSSSARSSGRVRSRARESGMKMEMRKKMMMREQGRARALLFFNPGTFFVLTLLFSPPPPLSLPLLPNSLTNPFKDPTASSFTVLASQMARSWPSSASRKRESQRTRPRSTTPGERARSFL